MDIARPATGFLIREPAHFVTYLAVFANQYPRVLAHWSDTKERLKMTAHREGHPVGHHLRHVFVAEGNAAAGFPTLRVAYFVFADTLTFIAILVVAPQM
jgi:hypothetical protein